MAKRDDRFYFDNFCASTDCACEAARLLQSIFADYRPERIESYLEQMHGAEHRGDLKKHEMLEALTRAFITPIEREDIMQLSQNIDEVTDTIEDALQRLYMHNVAAIRPEAQDFAALVVRCCDTLREAVGELADFKRSKKLHGLIVKVNELEEETDRLYLAAMRRLHTPETPLLSIIAWHEVFSTLEDCADACEHVTDVLERVILKNS